MRTDSGRPEFGSDTVFHFLPHKDAAPIVEIHKRLDEDQEKAASFLLKNLQLDTYRVGKLRACRIIRSVCVIRDESIITESCVRGLEGGGGRYHSLESY